jgi:hypothetical protein
VRTQSHSGITYFLISGSAISSANWLNSTRLLIFILYTPGTKSHICISRHVKACTSSTGRGAASEDSRDCRRKHRHWAGACRCGANVKGGRLNSTQVANSTTDTEQIVASRSGSWRDRKVTVGESPPPEERPAFDVALASWDSGPQEADPTAKATKEGDGTGLDTRPGLIRDLLRCHQE